MLGRVAEGHALVCATQPEAGIAPGHGIKLPALRLHFFNEVRDGNLERVDPDTAAQRSPATCNELIHGEMSRHDSRYMAQKVIG